MLNHRRKRHHKDYAVGDDKQQPAPEVAPAVDPNFVPGESHYSQKDEEWFANLIECSREEELSLQVRTRGRKAMTPYKPGLTLSPELIEKRMAYLEELGYLDVTDEKPDRPDFWEHFIVNKATGSSACKYCQRRYSQVDYVRRSSRTQVVQATMDE